MLVMIIAIGIMVTVGGTGCSGYKFNTQDNPFEQYGVTSISVPMFQTIGSVPNVAGPFTREIFNTLLRYPGLKVYPGDYKKTDAVLLGIVVSSEYIRSAIASVGIDKVNVAGRSKPLNIPTGTSINLTLKLILIKDPTQNDFDYFLSTFSKYKFNHPKVIFQESIGVTDSFSRSRDTGVGNDSGGSINFTQNKGQESVVIRRMASTTSST